MYKRQAQCRRRLRIVPHSSNARAELGAAQEQEERGQRQRCLLYTSDAADDLLCVDLGGRRIIKKKKTRST